jgi:hypothetical protein
MALNFPSGQQPGYSFTGDNGITYTYDGVKWLANVAGGVGSSTYSNANVKSYLTHFDGNIIPASNAAYSLGDATHQWQSLHVSGQTIYIGGIALSAGENGLTSNAGFDLANANAATLTSGNIVSDGFFFANGINILTAVSAGTADRLTNNGHQVTLQANGVVTFENTATISNNGEFRIWSDTDITVYKNGQDGYAVKQGRIENWINNGRKTVIDSTGLTIQTGALKGNLVNFGQNSPTLGAPASDGSTDRIRLWDFYNTNPTGYNYAIGAEGNHVWFAMDVDSDSGGFKFYSQANLAMKIGGHGRITLGSRSQGIFWSNGTPYSTGGGGTSTTIGDTAPAGSEGALWYNTDDGRLYANIGTAWVDASPTVAPPPSYYLGNNLEITDIEESGHKLVIIQDANNEQPGIDGTEIDYIPTATLEANDWIGIDSNYPETAPIVTFANGETRPLNGWNTDSFGTSGFLSMATGITISGADAWPITVTAYNYVHPQAVLNFGNNTLTVDHTGNLLVNGNLVTGSGGGTPTDVYDPNGDVTIQTQSATWTFNACNTLSWPSNNLTVSTYGGNSSWGSSGSTTFTTYTGFTFNANTGMAQWQMDVHGNLILPTGGFINYANGVNILSTIVAGSTYSNANVASYLLANPSIGDITFSGSDIVGAGNEVVLTADTTNWTFYANGNIALPNGSSIDAGLEGYGIGLTTNRGTILFGNSPELGQLNHYHIMKEDAGAVDLFFGDDTDYLHLPPSGGVGIGASGYSWTFGRDGVLALPGANAAVAAIGAIETPDSIDLYGNASVQYVQLNWDNQNFVYVDSYGAHMQAGPTAPGEYEIFLSTDGSTTFPDHMPVSITGNLTVGNLIVNGNTTTINTTSYSVTDNIVQFAADNPADTLDIGFVGHRTVNSTLQHTGLVRDASTGLWKLFSNVTAQPGTTVDFSNAIFDDLQLDKLYADTIHLTGTAPITAQGTSGDLEGDIHVDADYLYYCIADWTNTAGPWTTTLTADKNPGDVFKIQIAKSSVYGTPTGDTFNNQGTAWLVSLNGVSTYVDMPAIDAGTDWILDLNSTPSVFGTGDVVVLTNPVASQSSIWKSIPLNTYRTAVTGTYSNVNVAAYLTTQTFYSNSNVASYLTANPQSGTYSNTNVAAYLTTGVTTANLTITGNVTQQSAYYERFANVTNTGGNLTCNFVNGSVFYATLTANVTVNFTNVAATAGTVVGATLIVDQGVTPYSVANLQINGGGIQTIKWAGGVGSNPGTGSNTDIMSFSLINLNGTAYRVLGQIGNYG